MKAAVTKAIKEPAKVHETNIVRKVLRSAATLVKNHMEGQVQGQNKGPRIEGPAELVSELKMRLE